MLIRRISTTEDIFNVIFALQDHVSYNYTSSFSPFVDTSGYVIGVKDDCSLVDACREIKRILTNFDSEDVQCEIAFMEEEYINTKLTFGQLTNAYVFFQSLMDYDMVIFDLNEQ